MASLRGQIPAFALAGLLVGTVGCPAKAPEDAAPAPAETTTAAAPIEDSKSFARKAHKAAFEAARELVRPMLELDDPIGAAQLGGTAPLPEALTPRAQEPLQAAVSAANKEFNQIDADHLDAVDAGMHRLVMFLIGRINAGLARNGPMRFDPGYGIAAAERFLDEIEFLLAHGRCEGCAPGVQRLGPLIDAARLDLGATSPEALAASIDDLERLRERIAALPRLAPAPVDGLEPAVAEALAAVERATEAGRRRLAHVRTAEAHPWGKPTLPAREGDEVRRLPSRVGKTELSRRLGFEEALDIEPKVLFDRAVRGLERITVLTGKHRPPRRGAPRPVDAERCRSLAEPVSAWAAGQKHAKAAIDCDAIARAAPRRLTDGELVDWIVRWGIVEPTRRARRATQDPAVALARGAIMPASHRDAATLAILGQLENQPGLAHALARARTNACLAATALWVHGELGTDDALAPTLRTFCPGRKPAAWVADAVARPRAALAGLGLSRLADRGATANMDKLWWAPAGADLLLAPREPHEPSGNIEVKIEPLRPGGGTG